MAIMSGLNGIIPGAQARSAGAEKTRRRLTMIAALNGWSVTLLGGLCFLLSVVWFSVWGLLVGAVAIASGCMELSGRRRAKQGQPEAGRWLAGSQLLLLGAIFIYAGAQFLWLKPQTVLSDMPAEYREALAPVMSEQELTEKIGVAVQLLYAAVMLGTLLYQGGLCLYYTRATRKILLEQALATGTLPHSPITPGGTETPKSDRAP